MFVGSRTRAQAGVPALLYLAGQAEPPALGDLWPRVDLGVQL